MGEAEVRQEDGLPCFSVVADEERRHGAPRVKAVMVSDASADRVTDVWSFVLPSPRARRVSSDACIRYGQAPGGSTATQALPLQAGKVYEVFLNAVAADSGDPTFGYTATFCLLAQADGTSKVKQLPGGRAATCEPPAR